MAALKKKTNPFAAEDDADNDVVDAPVEKDPEVSLDDDEDDPVDDPQPNRSERRKNRYRENIEAREAAERRASELQQQLALATTQAQQALMMAQQRQMQPQQPQQDPIDIEEGKLLRERQVLHREYEQRMASQRTSPITEEEKAGFEKRALELEGRQMDLRVERRLRGMPQQGNPQAEALRAHLAMQYPDVVSNQQAVLFADGMQKTLQATGRNPWAPDTIDEVMDKTRRQFRMGKYANGAPREPDPRLQDRLQSTGRGASAGAPTGPRTVKMTKELRKMADAAYRHIKDPGARYKAFAKANLTDDSDD